MARPLVNYVSYLIFIICALLFYYLNPYYGGFLYPQTTSLLLAISLVYVLLGFPYYYVAWKRDKEYEGSGFKALLAIFHVLKQIESYFRDYRKKSYKSLHKDQKALLLFLLVKFFYIPLMLNFLVGHIGEIAPYTLLFLRGLPDVSVHALILNYFYPLIVILMFTLDTLWFSFGYLFSFSFLGNRIRSVEPTLLGWVVTLVAYPPFNDTASLFFAWNVGDKIIVPQLWLTYLFRVAILVLFGIFLLSTFALGTKCSNLTNRGIVSRGPYRFVRHPAYTAKVMAWWVMTIPFVNIGLVLGGVFWTIVYVLRALTEERHLSADPDYQDYMKKVKWRFIPKIL